MPRVDRGGYRARMVEDIAKLPAGVRGCRVWGTLTRHEYDTLVLPVLQEAVGEDEQIRYVLQVGPGFDGVQQDVSWDDAKDGVRVIALNARWHRTAIVTEVESILRAIALFGWLTPGDIETFDLDELQDAINWAAD